MNTDVFRYSFTADVPLEEAEQTLLLATFAVEGLCGAARVRMDLSYHVHEPQEVILIDATTDIGLWVAQVFTNLLLHEFGENSFQVRRVDACPAPRTEGRAA